LEAQIEALGGSGNRAARARFNETGTLKTDLRTMRSSKNGGTIAVWEPFEQDSAPLAALAVAPARGVRAIAAEKGKRSRRDGLFLAVRREDQRPRFRWGARGLEKPKFGCGVNDDQPASEAHEHPYGERVHRWGRG